LNQTAPRRLKQKINPRPGFCPCYRLHYKHHLETNYCISGEGEVEDLATGQVFPIRPGAVYALDKHDAHVVRARTDLRFVCVFTPALTGTETHQPDGSYAPAQETG